MVNQSLTLPKMFLRIKHSSIFASSKQQTKNTKMKTQTISISKPQVQISSPAVQTDVLLKVSLFATILALINLAVFL
jgi:hypothetical protein